MTFVCRAGVVQVPCQRDFGASTVRALSDDPYAVLGVAADASAAEIAAARRRLARSVHPDHGGDLAVMQALNAAHDEALRRQGAASPGDSVRETPRPAQAAAPPSTQKSSQRVQHDSPSFVVDVAPAQAHEALLVVGSSIGEVIVANPPSMIECLLDEPIRCWCRLDLLPEGEATSVSLIVERYDGDRNDKDLAPDIDAVRDALVASLNEL